MSSPQQGSIAERIALGKEQNSTDGGAIVPFPAGSDFDDPFAMLRSHDRSWLAHKQNNGYRLTTFVYRSAEGLPIFCVLRVDHPEKGKDIRPIRCEKVSGIIGDVVMRHLEGTRPLYNLDQLAKRPDDPVLIVEGEKTADAAEARFGTHVVTTWPGGAQSVGKIELLPLVGRNVTIWPDNDPEGRKAANKLAADLLRIGAASCRIVNVPETFPPKWDLADDVPGDIGSEGIQALLDGAPLVTLAQVTTVVAAKPRPEPTAVNNASVSQDESMLRFLIDNRHLDLGGRNDWIRVGIAIKASQGEPGFELWDRLSSEALGYDETNIRKEWDTFKDRTEGESKLTLATFAKMARDNGWVPPTSPAGRTNPGSSGQDADPAPTPRFGKGHDAAVAAVELAEDAGDEFWLDQHEKAHVTYRIVTKDGEELTRHGAIVSAGYRGVLSRRYHDAVPGKVLQKEAASNALALLEYKADESGLRFTSSLRVAEHNECVYIDLGQQYGSAVQIDQVGWRVVTNPPVRFVRGSRGAMPLPEPGGTITDFEKHFNLSPYDVVRTVSFMIGTFNMTGSYPILFIEGEQGTCKSTLADMIVALTDPPTGVKSARFSFTRDEKDLHIAAKGSRVLYFDNISNIKAQEADALCRMATGAASSSRKLYTDDEEARLVVVKPVIATSIGLPSSRADLLSRCLRVRTEPVKTRRTEKAVMRDFEKDRPKLLGFLFDCVSEALRNREEVEGAVDRGEIALPRMGDFGQFVEGAAVKLGLERGQFSQMVEREQGELQADSAFTHPVGAALFAYFSRTDAAPINGSAGKVLELLRSQSPYESWWPAANKFRNELTRIAAGLRELGIEFEVSEAGGRDHVMRFRIYVTSAFTPASATTASGADHF